MRYLAILAILFLLLVGAASAEEKIYYGAQAVGVRDCRTVKLTTTMTEIWVQSDWRNITYQFEPDATGTATTAQLSMYTCSRTTAASCGDYKWDSTGDGLPDTQILDGVSDKQRGNKVGIRVPGIIRFQVSTPPGANDAAELQFCSDAS